MDINDTSAASVRVPLLAVQMRGSPSGNSRVRRRPQAGGADAVAGGELLIDGHVYTRMKLAKPCLQGVSGDDPELQRCTGDERPTRCYSCREHIGVNGGSGPVVPIRATTWLAFCVLGPVPTAHACHGRECGQPGTGRHRRLWRMGTVFHRYERPLDRAASACLEPGPDAPAGRRSRRPPPASRLLDSSRDI